MLKKLCALALSLLMFQTAYAFAPDAARPNARAEKVKSGIARLGTGESARVKVKLFDGRKLEGHVAEADAEHFVVADKAGAATRVEYTQVKKVSGHNLSTGAKIGIGVTIGVIVTLAVLYLTWAANER